MDSVVSLVGKKDVLTCFYVNWLFIFLNKVTWLIMSVVILVFRIILLIFF